MPCHVWRNLATKAMSIRESYSYFAFNKEAEMVSERNRTQSMKEREEAYVAACNAMDTHRQYCEKWGSCLSTVTPTGCGFATVRSHARVCTESEG